LPPARARARGAVKTDGKDGAGDRPRADREVRLGAGEEDRSSDRERFR
jgi:hypothetical protein